MKKYLRLPENKERGILVGDRVEKEVRALMVILEDLSKDTGLKMNIDAIKEGYRQSGCGVEKGKRY